MLVGLNSRIFKPLLIEKYDKKCGLPLKTAQDYLVDNVSEKLVRIVPSYIDYVNKYVWQLIKMNLIILSILFLQKKNSASIQIYELCKEFVKKT